MRIVVQRVSTASVFISGEEVGKIDRGYMILVGISNQDTKENVYKMAKKVANLRVFEDNDNKLNLNIKDVCGKILSISQFTLYGDCQRGNRPSFTNAAKSDVAKPLYELFNEALREYQIEVLNGVFGADMKVNLINDGPVTIIMEE